MGERYWITGIQLGLREQLKKLSMMDKDTLIIIGVVLLVLSLGFSYAVLRGG